MNRTLLIVIGFLSLLITCAAHGETLANGNIFVGYSYLNADFTSGGRTSLSGWNASVEGKVFPFLAIVGDFSGHYGSLNGAACPIPVGALPGSCIGPASAGNRARLLHADRALSYAFLSYLISRNIRLEEDLIDQVSHSSERRLARALPLLAGKGNRRRLHRFAGISQETLATIIGTTRPRVNFFMNKFGKLGFIKYRGRPDQNGDMQINTSLLAKALRN
jgi:hypothetical protein